MSKSLTDTLAGLVAVLVSAKKSGDELLVADVEWQLSRKHGIEIKFATDRQIDARKGSVR